MKQCYLLILSFLIFSCNNANTSGEKEKELPQKDHPEQIVLISKNSPGKIAHSLSGESGGEEESGPRMYLPHYGFSYLDDQNIVRTWVPQKEKADTLVISWYAEDLELTAHHPYSAIEETFLVKNGDTVVFDYREKTPVANVINREVNEIQLNYNGYRRKKLFNDDYSSHQMIFLNLILEGIEDHKENTLNHYQRAREDYLREKQLLDSLRAAGTLSGLDHQYRLDALEILMENHKRNKTVREWLQKEYALRQEGTLEKLPAFDLAKTDSLMKFHFFRQHLKNISRYELGTIVENNGNSGSNYIDSRERFDSIVADKRFNQTAKNFLLFDAYEGIGRNFKVRDKQKYFQKLSASTTNPVQLKKLVEDHKLDFEFSDQLLLSTLSNDSLSYREAIMQNKGKWLYVDFWASWCAPCRRSMPYSRKLKEALKAENIVFMYLALNDRKEQWREAIKADAIEDGQHYFIENANSSKVLEELGVKSIPHYIIYNPEGEIVSGFAKRPGRGAKEQLEELLKE